jgi:hypothetical protein
MRVRANGVRNTLERPTLRRRIWLTSWLFMRSNRSAPWAGIVPRKPRITPHHSHNHLRAGLFTTASPLVARQFPRFFRATSKSKSNSIFLYFRGCILFVNYFFTKVQIKLTRTLDYFNFRSISRSNCLKLPVPVGPSFTERRVIRDREPRCKAVQKGVTADVIIA